MARNPRALAPDSLSPSLLLSLTRLLRLGNPLITLPHIKSYKLITNDWGHARNKYRINIIDLILSAVKWKIQSERKEIERETRHSQPEVTARFRWNGSWVKWQTSGLRERNERDNNSHGDAIDRNRAHSVQLWTSKRSFYYYSKKCFIYACILKAEDLVVLEHKHLFIHNIWAALCVAGLRAVRCAVHLNDSRKCWTLIQSVMPSALRFTGQCNLASNQWGICIRKSSPVKFSSICCGLHALLRIDAKWYWVNLDLFKMTRWLNHNKSYQGRIKLWRFD